MFFDHQVWHCDWCICPLRAQMHQDPLCNGVINHFLIVNRTNWGSSIFNSSIWLHLGKSDRYVCFRYHFFGNIYQNHERQKPPMSNVNSQYQNKSSMSSPCTQGNEFRAKTKLFLFLCRLWEGCWCICDNYFLPQSEASLLKHRGLSQSNRISEKSTVHSMKNAVTRIVFINFHSVLYYCR